MNSPLEDEKLLRQQIEAIASTTADGIFTIDQHGTVLSVNDKAAQMFGRTKRDLLQQNVIAFMGDEEAAYERAYQAEHHKSSILKVLNRIRDVKGKRLDGSEFPFRLTVKRVSSEKKTLYTCVAHDLTRYEQSRRRILDLHEQLKAQNEILESTVKRRTAELELSIADLAISNRKLEQEIKEREAIARALQKREVQLERLLSRERELGELKSRFVSMASHEFRTPLTTMLSSAEIIEMALPTPPELVNRHLRRIKESIGYLNNVLEDFLQLGKLEEKADDLQIQHFNLKDFLNQFVEDLNQMCKPGQDIELAYELAEDHITHSYNALRIIITNLVTNAIKYSPEGSAIDISLQEMDHILRIQVKDEGMGIPKQELPYLFDKFFRASNVLTIKGTGLGLHIIARYTNKMGGKVDVKSEPGQGSTFTVDLPRSLTA